MTDTRVVDLIREADERVLRLIVILRVLQDELPDERETGQAMKHAILSSRCLDELGRLIERGLIQSVDYD